MDNARDTVSYLGPNSSIGKPGQVSERYFIGKYPVTVCEYVKFLNFVDPNGTNPNDIYTPLVMNNTNRIEYMIIDFSPTAINGTKYSPKLNMDKKPMYNLNILQMMQYCNWLHNGMIQSAVSDSTYDANHNIGIYNVAPAIRPTKLTSLSNNIIIERPEVVNGYYIPTEDQWYKAAYYKRGSTNAGYWKYATQSDDPPIAVQSDDTGKGLARNSDYRCI